MPSASPPELSPSPTTALGTTTTTTPEPVSVVRFVALGDAGEGNDDQYLVAETIGNVCAERGCDFALYLGDNFYDSGVDDVDDEQFQTKFELPYANLDFPFYAVLGNHDLGLDGLGLEFWKANIYVEYTDYSTKWIMLDRFYSFQSAHVGFYALDSTQIFFGLGSDQEDWLIEELDNAPPEVEWKVVFAHHPYVSNGQHGNAGQYEGIPEIVPLSEIPRGQFVEDLVDAAVCGRADLYLSGHDHNLQWLEPTCGTEFIVSGAGAKTDDLVGRGTPTFFEHDALEGFLWAQFEGNQFDGTFYDRDGVELFSMSYSK